MKKLLAILLALMMVLVSVAAFADGEGGEGEGGEAAAADANILQMQDPTLAKEYNNTNDANDPNNGKIIGNTAAASFKITKAYKVTGDSTAVVPAHKLTFTVEPVKVENSTSGTFPSTNVSVTPISVPAATADGAKLDMVFNLPTYTEPGVYYYKVTEDTGAKVGDDGTELTTPHVVAGVQYVTTEYELKITVIEGSALAAGMDPAPTGLVVGGVALREKNKTPKIDTIENEYIAASVKVEKQVTGNMGDQKRPFSFKVTFTSATDEYVDAPIAYTQTTYAADGTKTTEDKTIAAGWTGSKEVEFELIHGDSITFTNVPEGVTYKAEETDTAATTAGYTTTDSGNTEAAIQSGDPIDVVFTNDKSIEIDTGVALDSAVYMLIMALALAGFAALKIRRREEN